jgi:hypothetical protein
VEMSLSLKESIKHTIVNSIKQAFDLGFRELEKVLLKEIFKEDSYVHAAKDTPITKACNDI